MTTETLQRPGKEAAGSRHEPGVGCQAATAATEVIGPPTEMRLAAVHLNRRVRSRTHGGVGGREEQSSLRPDQLPKAHRSPYRKFSPNNAWNPKLM